MIRERSECTMLRQLWLNYGIRLHSGRVVRMSVLGGALPTIILKVRMSMWLCRHHDVAVVLVMARLVITTPW